MQPDLSDVLDRLARLERENAQLHRGNRRLRRGGLLGIALFAFFGLVSCSSKSNTPATQSTIEAEKFVLKDSSGRIQGSFSTSADGPVLLMLDPNEKAKPRVGIVAGKDGPTLSMYDTAGQERVRLGWSTAGGTGVVLLGTEGKPHVGITDTAKGTALELIDGDRRTELSLSPDLQRLVFFNKAQPRVGLAVVPQGPMFDLFDDKGSSLFSKP